MLKALPTEEAQNPKNQIDSLLKSAFCQFPGRHWA